MTRETLLIIAVVLGCFALGFGCGVAHMMADLREARGLHLDAIQSTLDEVDRAQQALKRARACGMPT